MAEIYYRVEIYNRSLDGHISTSTLPICSQVMDNLESKQTREETAKQILQIIDGESDENIILEKIKKLGGID